MTDGDLEARIVELEENSGKHKLIDEGKFVPNEIKLLVLLVYPFRT